MKKYRYYYECASGANGGVLCAMDEKEAEEKLRKLFQKKHPSESMWVYFVKEIQ